MIVHFEDEKVPMPRFANNQMADIVAYLHSGNGTSTDATQTSSGAKGGSAETRTCKWAASLRRSRCEPYRAPSIFIES